KNITLNNITTNCPRCGGMASPDDGTYNVRAGHWHLIRGITDDLRSAQATADDYVRLLRLLRQAQATGEGADKVADEIAAQTPFGRLAETIRTHPPGWTAYILAAILAVVLWLVSPPGHSESPSPEPGHGDRPGISLQAMSPHELDELAQEIAQRLHDQNVKIPEEHAQNVKVPEEHAPTRQLKGSQRNKPCPCGSRRKYKKCCGAPTREPQK